MEPGLDTGCALLDQQFQVNRVEPRESHSRPVVGESFLLPPPTLTRRLPQIRLGFVEFGGGRVGVEVAMTDDHTITLRRPGGC